MCVGTSAIRTVERCTQLNEQTAEREAEVTRRAGVGAGGAPKLSSWRNDQAVIAWLSQVGLIVLVIH
jgi:hypothetical protein